MAFVSLGKRRFSRADADAFRIAVEKKTVVFKPPGSVLAELGWSPDGTKVDLQEGQGEDAGFLRLAADPNGWKLQRAGGKGSTGYVIKASRTLFRGPPEPMKTTLVDQYQIIDGALVVRVPWQTPKQRDEAAGKRPVPSVRPETCKPAPVQAASMAEQQHNTMGVTRPGEQRPTIPERATAVDPESKPPEAGDARAVDGAGSSSEADPAERGGGPATSLFRMPGDTDTPGRAGGTGGSPAPEPNADAPPPSGGERPSEAEKLPGAAGSLAPRATPEPEAQPLPVQPRALAKVEPLNTDPAGDAGAPANEATRPAARAPAPFGRMSAWQTEEFVQAVARGARLGELEAIVTKLPARYGCGTVHYLKEQLATRIAAALPGKTVTRVTAAPVTQPQPPAAPPLKAGPLPSIPRPTPPPASNGSAAPSNEASAPPPIPETVLKFLRDKVAPVLAPLGRKVSKNPRKESELLLDGQPVTLEAVIAEANRILEADGDQLLVAPAIAA